MWRSIGACSPIGPERSSMRDYLFLAILLASVPLSFLRPYFGIICWCVISYLNPHRYTWGIAYNFPAAMAIGGATLAGLFFTKERRAPPATRETILLGLFWCLLTVTTVFAIHPDEAAGHWEITTKILVMTYVTMALVITRKQLHYFLLTIALSMGLIGLKGGLFAILSGGHSRVYGPPDSFIADNNDVALAMNMALPLLFYLGGNESNRWLRRLLRVMFVFTIIAIIFTYSRGGFLGLIAVLLILLFRSRRKMLGFVALAAALGLAVEFIPQQYVSRISTIENYEEDTSAMGRISAWKFSINVALARPLVGGGFRVAGPDTYRRYQPTALRPVDAHSIYFEVLGEQGFIGLILFVAILILTFRSCSGILRVAARLPDAAWMRPYAQMLQGGVLAYMVSGLFLSRAYFDLAYHLIAGTVCLRVLARQAVRTARAPAEGAEGLTPAPESA
jgi:probable O-glycosylation ligase (exosortase A-associated)